METFGANAPPQGVFQVDMNSRLVSHRQIPLGPVNDGGGCHGAMWHDDKLWIAALRLRGNLRVWMVEVASGIFSRVTSDPGGSVVPAWSPNGQELVFSSIRTVDPARANFYNLYRKRVGGSPEVLLFESGEPKFPAQWLPDGSIIFSTLWSKKFYRLQLGGERKPELLFQSEFEKEGPLVSPNGRWAAYTATDSGQWEVYLASYPGFNEQRQISTDGGFVPLWGKKGRELYYWSHGKVMVVDVKDGAALETGIPHELFAVPPGAYDVTSDGRKFFVLQNVDQGSSPMNVMLNWTAALSRPDRSL